MMLTKEQLSELICKHSERENGLGIPEQGRPVIPA